MSLDIALLGTDGAPEVEARIDVTVHPRLIALATSLDLGSLLRLRDYYADVDFQPTEVPHLRAEVLQALAVADAGLRRVLIEVDAVLAEAERRGASIHIIAD